MSNFNPDFSKVENKIKKLLALATSDNEHEAATAMRQAMKLMAKYDIKEEDLDDAKIVKVKYASDYKKPPQFMQTLYYGISESFGVFTLIRNGKGSIPAEIILMGKRADVDRAMYLFIVAYTFIVKKSEEYKRSLDYKLTTASLNDYRAGAALGFVSSLKETYAEAEGNQAAMAGKELVPVDTRLQDAREWADKCPDVTYTMASHSLRNNRHSTSGFSDGKEIKINDGLTNETNTLRKL